MKVDGKKLAQSILTYLKKDVTSIKRQGKIKPPKLVIFSVRPAQATESFMKYKAEAANKVGARFELILYRKTPRFEDFANRVKEVAENPETTGVVIQHPLPASLTTVTLLDYIPMEKEIEGFKKKSIFDEPIGLAVLTVFKHIFDPKEHKIASDILIDLKKDLVIFKRSFKRKRVVLLGRGKTGGEPIGKILAKAKINYINLNSQSSSAGSFIQQADVIISAVGQTVVVPDMVKEGAILVSVGMHRENGLWKGDYDESSIKNKVLAYTPTPGGIGPLNVAYLMNNLILAWKVQNNFLKL